MLGVSREPRSRPIRGWVAALFCVKTRGVGRGDFVTLIRVSCQKAVRSQLIITLLAELGGSDSLVISFMGGEGE